MEEITLESFISMKMSELKEFESTMKNEVENKELVATMETWEKEFRDMFSSSDCSRFS